MAIVDRIIEIGTLERSAEDLRQALLVYFEEEAEPLLLQQEEPTVQPAPTVVPTAGGSGATEPEGNYWTDADGYYCWRSPNGQWTYWQDADGNWVCDDSEW